MPHTSLINALCAVDTAYDPLDLARHLSCDQADLFLPKALRSLLLVVRSGAPLTEEQRTLIRTALLEEIPDFRTIRSASGLTQAALAERFRIPQRTIESWDGGQRTPPPYVRLMLLELLGLMP